MHLNTCSPSGDDAIQRANPQPAFSQDLFEQVLQRDNILAAWHRVRANKGAPGVDGMTIEAFPAWARSGHWKRTATELRVGQYHPAPVRRVEIDKPDGGKRQLGIPTVTDRVIQQAIAQVLTPIFGRFSLYVLVNTLIPPDNHDFVSSRRCSFTLNQAK